MILGQILERKLEELEAARRRVSLAELKARVADMPPVRDFTYAIFPSGATGQGIRIIAEIKQASPSRGVICQDFNPVAIAKCYQENGAAAISVLTEQHFFKGSLKYLSRVRKVTNLPLLRKDFIFSDYQIYETLAAGGDALLLISAMLAPAQTEDLYGRAIELGLCPIIEVHAAGELKLALQLNPKIIGINNRNLKIFDTDLEVTTALLANMPKGKIVVSESGIHTREDLLHLEQAGVAAALIGEELMSASDIGLRLRQLSGREA